MFILFLRMFNVGKEGKFDICILSDIRTICVTVNNINNIDGKSVTEFCQCVRKLLDKVFGDMRHNFPWMQSMEFEYGIRCPICAKSPKNCEYHNAESCTRNSCLHFVSEVELNDDSPRCYEDETNTDNFIKEEAYSHWFPKTKEFVSLLW